MSQYAPDWSSAAMGDAFAPLLCGGDDGGLVELLWCNGHVVMQSQAPLKPPPPPTRPDKAAQDDEPAWFQYAAAEEDALERDLFAELFGETAPARKDRTGSLMPPPPRPAHAPCVLELELDPDRGHASAGDGLGAKAEGGDSSMLTVGSSFCGSNHVQAAGSRCAAGPPPRGGSGKDAATVTSSSSMRPRSCTTRSAQPGSKRKQSDDAAEAEDAEFESAGATREPPAQKLTTAKRRRAAEVHNLSERRRRDRINEKMKALQELIPHCNKTDKASMLDEAIEYLKSLQLQLQQMMWMGGGMAAAAPVVYQAGVDHQYVPQMVAPPHHAHVASVPRMPFMAPPVPDPYARFLAVDHLQPAPPPMHFLQGMGFYPPQIPAPPPPATARTSPSDGILHKKHESCGKSDVQGMTG